MFYDNIKITIDFARVGKNNNYFNIVNWNWRFVGGSN